MKKKVVALVLCMVMLVAVSVTGTLAYLTSQDQVTNTFTVGNVKITMDETNTDGSKDAIGETPARDKSNSYKLLPGGTYTKDPIVHVDPVSEDCYVIVFVENQLTAIEASDNTIAMQMTKNGWVKKEDVANGSYWIYNGFDAMGNVNSAAVKVTGASALKVFDTFTVTEKAHYSDTTAEGDTLNLKDVKDKQIIVKAFAIQADNVDETTALAQAKELNN